MTKRTLKRIFTALGIAAGIVTAAATPAAAALNHSEPTIEN